MLLYSDYGKRIKKLRERLEFTQEDFAEIFHVTKQAVSGWELGKFLPADDIREKLQDVYGVVWHKYTFRKNEDRKVEVKPLNAYADVSELLKTVEDIISQLDLDDMFEKTIRGLLKKTLLLVVGYDVYYNARVYKPDYVCEWQDVAAELSDLLDQYEGDKRRQNIMNLACYSIYHNMITKKIHVLMFDIGAELFEDFDDEGYRNGNFDYDMGRLAESCADDLLKVLPQEDNVFLTLFKASVLRLSELICEL